MCFSAPVSFIAGAALVATGVATTQKAPKKEKMIGVVPIIFGVQQLIEGGLWMTLGSAPWSTVFTYGFLLFAYVIWPVYTPIAVLSIETSPLRRKVLKVSIVLGAVVSGYLLTNMFTHNVMSEITHKGSLVYLQTITFWKAASVLYVLATCGSCLVSSKKFIRIFGILLCLSLIAAAALYLTSFGSVWCFFAAFLSLWLGIAFLAN
ncbi:MAG: hypothetical protein NTX63_03255 [Candidatus Peregrinibacteria bacterium]|nr:hypothetical protein [Candidatus Peregrinibacteria bacterium]